VVYLHDGSFKTFIFLVMDNIKTVHFLYKIILARLELLDGHVSCYVIYVLVMHICLFTR